MPPDMPEEMKKHLYVLYDHAPDHHKCIPALRAIAAMGPEAVQAAPFLASALYAPDNASQSETVRTLIAIGRSLEDPTPVIESVSLGLFSGYGRHMRKCLDIISQLGGADVAPTVVSAMASGSRLRLPGTLAGEVMRYLGEALTDERAEVRRTALVALAACQGIPTPWITERLLRAMEDPDREVRMAAVRGLEVFCTPDRRGRISSPAPFRESMLQLLSDTDPYVRRIGVLLIANAEGEADRQMKAVIALVGDPEERVRNAVLASIGSGSGTEVVAALAKASQHPDPMTRASVVAALARTGHPDAVPAVEKLMKDTDPAVRESAITALADLKGEEVSERLAGMLNEAGQDPLILRRLLMILGEWKAYDLIGDIGRFIEHPDDSVARPAVDVAVHMGDDAQKSLVKAFLNADRMDLANYAGGVLRAHFKPTPERVAMLLPLVKHPDLLIRKNALAVLAQRKCLVSNTALVREALDDTKYYEEDRDAFRLVYAIEILRRNKDYSDLDRVASAAVESRSRRVHAAASALFSEAGARQRVAALYRKARERASERARERAQTAPRQHRPTEPPDRDVSGRQRMTRGSLLIPEMSPILAAAPAKGTLLVDVSSDYRNALAELGRLLADGATNAALQAIHNAVMTDSPILHPHWTEPRRYVSSIEAATAVLAKLPDPVLNDYRQEQQKAARASLSAAKARGDLPDLLDTGLRYACVPTGGDALNAYAWGIFDSGRCLEAATIWARLAADAQGTTAPGQMLMLKSALAYQLAGDLRRSEAVRVRLERSRPGFLQVAGRRQRPGDVLDAVAHSSNFASGSLPIAVNWRMAYGNAAANAVMPPAPVPTKVRWFTEPSTRMPRLNAALQRLGAENSTYGPYRVRPEVAAGRARLSMQAPNRPVTIAGLPASIHPLVLDDRVLVRDEQGVYARDVATGDAIWSLTNFPVHLTKGAGNLRNHYLPYAGDTGRYTLSTDGSLILAVGKLRRIDPASYGKFRGFGGR